MSDLLVWVKFLTVLIPFIALIVRKKEGKPSKTMVKVDARGTGWSYQLDYQRDPQQD